MLKTLLPVLVVLAVCGSAFAADPVPAKNEQGLTATLINNKETYTLDAGQSGKEFRDQVANLKPPGAKFPGPPTVDFVLRITNSSDKDVTLNIGGDSSRLELTLTGEGALTVNGSMMMDRMYRQGTPTTIAAGKTYDLKITALSFGVRGESKYAYFTEAGEYTLAASLVYNTGTTQLTVAAEPIKVKVEAAKP